MQIKCKKFEKVIFKCIQKVIFLNYLELFVKIRGKILIQMMLQLNYF